MNKRKVFWGLAVIALCFFLRGVFLEAPLYVWGKTQGLRISISPFSSFGLHHIELRHLNIRDGYGHPIFSAARVRAAFETSPFLHGSLVSSLSSLDLRRPRLTFYRDSQGKWSPSLFSGKSDWLETFKAKITLDEGEMSILDDLWRQGQKPTHISISAIQGTADFAPASAVEVALKAGTETGGVMTIHGKLSRPTYCGILELKAAKLPLAIFGDYLLHQENMHFTAGTFQGRTRIWVSRSGVPSVSGELRVLEGALAATNQKGFKIAHIASNLRLEKTFIQLENIRGRFGKSLITGGGIVSLSGISRYSFSFESPSFALSGLKNMSELIEKMNPEGTAKVNLDLAGQDSDFLWEANIVSPQFLLNSIPASGLLIHFSNMNDDFHLDRAQWKIGNENVLIRGTAQPDEYASFLIQGKNIPLSNLAGLPGASPLTRGLQIQNTGGTATFTLLFHRFHGEDILVAASKLRNVAFSSVKMRNLDSRFFISKNAGWLDDFALTLDQGNLRGKGAWLGADNPFLGGEFQGKIGKTKLHSYLFGRWKDVYLADPSGALRGSLPTQISGMVDVTEWPLRFDENHVSLDALASGRLLFRVGPQKIFSGFGLGKLSRIRTGLINARCHSEPFGFAQGKLREESAFKADLSAASRPRDDMGDILGNWGQSPISLEDADWSLGVRKGQGGGSMTSPSLALFGRFGGNWGQSPISSRFFFVGTASPEPFSLSASGDISRGKSSPLFSLSMVGHGRWNDKPTAFSGDFSGHPNNLRVENFQAVLGPSLYRLNGDLLLPLGEGFKLQGSLTHSEISFLSGILPNTPFWLKGVSGNLSGRFSVEKKENAFGGNLHFFVHDGEIWKQPISTAYLDARIQKETINFNPLVVRSSENYLFANGSLGLNGRMNVHYEIPRLSLADLGLGLGDTSGSVPAPWGHFRKCPHLEGILQMRGSLNGSVYSPGGSAQIDLSHFRANRIHLDKIQAKASYRNRTFEIQQARFTNGSGALSGNASLMMDSPLWLKTDLTFSKFDLETLLAWHAMRSFGMIDGKIYLAGPLPSLNGNFDLRLSKENSPTGEAAGLIKKGIASFSTLRLKVGEGEISGSGNLNVEKPSTFHVEGNNLNLRLLSELTQSPAFLTGTGAFKAEILTSVEHPEMDVEITLSQPAFKQLSASSFEGRLLYRKGKISLVNGQVFEPHGVLLLTGEVPISLSSKHIIKPPFEMRLKLENQDLKLLSDFYPNIDASGLTDADFKISFHPDHYVVDGKARVQAGTLFFPGMLNEIEDLNGAVLVDRNNLRFSALGSLVNPVEATGRFELSGDYASNPLHNGEVQLTGDQLLVEIPHAQVHLTPDLQLSYDSTAWKLTGNATVDDGDVNTDLFSASVQHQIFPKLSQLQLDTTVNVSDKVHIHHPHFDAQGSGFLKIGGVISNPQLSGELNGHKGTLSFLGYDFNLTRGSATFSPGRKLPFVSVEGVSVRRIQGALIYVKLSGYPKDLHLEIASDPPLTQNELSLTLTQHQPVERYMSAGGQDQFMQQQASRWFSTGVSSQVFSPIENVFGSTFNLEYFSFDFLPGGQLGLEVGKQISPHVAVTYSRAVTGALQQIQTDPGAVWGVEYHLSPKITVRGTQDQLTGFGGQILSKWNF